MEQGASLARGLAVRADNQSLIDNELKMYQAEIQQEAQKRKENWMLTNDIEFGNAFDPYNKQRLKVHTDKIMDKISGLISNGDVLDNPEKLAELQSYKRQLVDNEIIDESIRFQTQRDFATQFLNDPRNREFLDEPEVQASLQQMETYMQTGSIDADQIERKEFMFRPPPTKINTAAIIAESFGRMERHGIANWGNGINGYRQFVLPEDMRKGAENLWQSQDIDGKNFRREWETMSDDEKKAFRNDPIYWITERGKAFVKEDKFQAGSFPSSVYGKGGRSGSSPTPPVDHFFNTIAGPLQYAAMQGEPNPSVFTNNLIGTLIPPSKRYTPKKTTTFYDVNGKPAQINLGTLENAEESTEFRLRTNDGAYEMGIFGDVPIDEFARANNEIAGLLDVDLWERASWLPGDIDENDDFEIGSKYAGIVEKTDRVDNRGVPLVRVKVYDLAPPDIGEKINNNLGLKQKSGVVPRSQFPPNSTVESGGHVFQTDEYGNPIF